MVRQEAFSRAFSLPPDCRVTRVAIVPTRSESRACSIATVDLLQSPHFAVLGHLESGVRATQDDGFLQDEASEPRSLKVGNQTKPSAFYTSLG